MTALDLAERLTLRVSEVSRLTGLPPSSVRDLLRRGELAYVVVSRGKRRLVLVEVDVLREFLASRRVDAAAVPPDRSLTTRPVSATKRGTAFTRRDSKAEPTRRPA